MHEAEELKFIEPFFASLQPRAVPLVGNEFFYRLVVNSDDWQLVIGKVTDPDPARIRIRGKYRVYKHMAKRNLIVYCKSCGEIIGSKLVDGFKRPWENICAKCFTCDDEQLFRNLCR